MHLKTFQLLLFLTLISYSFCNLSDPYTILSVTRNADFIDIRRAYKKLAKTWHPDKTDSHIAQEKFIEIKKAYELLSDPVRRKIYNQHGVTNEDSFLLHKSDRNNKHKRFSSHVPLTPFVNYKYEDEDEMNFYHEISVTAKFYEKTIVVNSRRFPYILLTYTDICFVCKRETRIFKKIINFLEPLGVRFGTVNTMHERYLQQKLKCSKTPSIILILDGQSFVFRENVFSLKTVVDFMRKHFPRRLIQEVNDSNIDDFLDGWKDNRVRAIFFESKHRPRLRYLIAAFAFKHRVVFGFVNLSSMHTKAIQERYKVNGGLDSLLIFNEDSSRPFASVAMSDIPIETLTNVLSSNQYLALPRLSSQEMLEEICPVQLNRFQKIFCVILVTKNTEAHNAARNALRKFALQNGSMSNWVRFAYIYQDSQVNFLSSISNESLSDLILRLVIIWRRDTFNIKYEWVPDTMYNQKHNGLDSSNYILNLTKEAMTKVIENSLHSSETLRYDASVTELFDEQAQEILWKMLMDFIYFSEHIVESIEQQHIISIICFLGTIAFICAIGRVMLYLVRLEDQSLDKTINRTAKKLTSNVTELRLLEFRAENYNGMVRLLKPGCRTIVLIVDLKTRSKLIPDFHKAVWPYRKTKTLMFGYMLIEKGLSWFCELLRLSLSEHRDLKINPRNCVGTVISLNGHRKYFCMYHAKHSEMRRGIKKIIEISNNNVGMKRDVEAGIEGAVKNFTKPKYESITLMEDKLLEGLSDWLHQLFEGATHRYYINYWPDFSK